MRVGIYVDAYNLYYGGRAQCGRGTPGWRWLDVRALAVDLVGRRRDWPGARVTRVVYCTARIDARTNPDGSRDQHVYLKALAAHGSVDHTEFGNYVARTKTALLADEDHKRRPVVAGSRWPVMVRTAAGVDVPAAQFMVKVLNLEEKGSDVNVATHLLLDVARSEVDAALVISNDSDLRLPISEVRGIVPLGLVHPGRGQLAGALRGQSSDGVGRHWWAQLGPSDFTRHQLPDPVAGFPRPSGW